MSEHPNSDRLTARPPSRWERAVLDRLITFAPTAAQAALAAQLGALIVVRECGCGCRTIAFGPDTGARQVIDGAGDDADGMVISFLLHVIEGRIASLEVIRGDGEAIREPPTPAAIDRVEWRDSDGVMQRIPGE